MLQSGKQEKSIVLEQLAKKNCAACGAPGCETFAEDVASGRITIDQCVFISRSSLAGNREETDE